MDKRSPRIPEGRERIESSCMWGLFGILQSCQGPNSPKLISNGRHINRNLTDNNVGKVDRVTSFDEECRRIQQGIDAAKDASDGSVKSSTKDNLSVDKNKTKQIKQHNGETDAKLVDSLTRTQKKARRSSRKACESSSSRSDDSSSLIRLPSTSAVSAQTSSSEGFQRNAHHGKYKQAQMSAKALVDQMFIDREIARKQGTKTDSKCFSSSLAALSSTEPELLVSKGVKNSNPSLIEIDAKSSDGRITGNPGSTLASRDGKMGKHSSRTINYRTSDKLEVMKPNHKHAKFSERVSCHCYSIQSPRRVTGRTADANLTKSFSFRETKKKLKHALVSTSGLSTSDAENCFDSMTKGKKPECISNRDSDISCVSDTVRKKLDFSDNGVSNKLPSDVISEAKRHLSERLKYVNDLEIVRNEKSSKTLRRILASPEHDFCPLSPKRGSHHVCTSPEMRFSPYSSPRRVDESSYQLSNGRDGTSLSPSRPKTIDISIPECISSDVETKMSNVVKEIDVTRTVETRDSSELRKDDDSALQSLSDSLSENEVSVSMADDFQSTPSSACTTDSSKYQDEYESPVSVLEPFFTEDANSPQTAPKPRRLKFEDHDPTMSPSSYILEQYPVSKHVHMIMQASCLDWDRLANIAPLPDTLVLDASLFDEMESLPIPCYFDSKLLFDRINEVLVEIRQSDLYSCSWQVSLKQKIAPLEEVVLGKITAEADFYLLPWTEQRSLDQIVSEDVAHCGPWIDVRLNTEEIVVEISDELLEECILDILVESLL